MKSLGENKLRSSKGINGILIKDFSKLHISLAKFDKHKSSNFLELIWFTVCVSYNKAQFSEQNICFMHSTELSADYNTVMSNSFVNIH